VLQQFSSTYFQFKINLEQCPPQDVSNCINGFICSLHVWGGCWTCNCLSNACGVNQLLGLPMIMTTIFPNQEVIFNLFKKVYFKNKKFILERFNL